MKTLFAMHPDPLPLAAPPAPAPNAGYAQIALERGVDAHEGFTYAIPKHMADLPVGARVLAPLGKQKVSGWVLSRSDICALDPRKVKSLLEWDKGFPLLPEDLVKLAAWMARYYASPIGQVFAAMLPAAVKHDTGSREVAQVRRSGKEAPAKLTALQKQILAVAEAEAGDAGKMPALPAGGDAGVPGAGGFKWLSPQDLAEKAGAKTTGPITKLLALGLLEEQKITQVKSRLDVQAARVSEAPKDIALSAGQAAALTRLEQGLGEGFGAFLLHGVTGSGKTEVYLRLIEKMMQEGNSPGVIVLVPEIALTPQTVGRFYARFPQSLVAVLHSGLTSAQRHAQWRRIESGEARIVVGARSAIFAPLKNLRLIIVDEEHEPSYKQDQAPRYHARDVAVCRAFNAKCPVVLGSATPALESYLNARGCGADRELSVRNESPCELKVRGPLVSRAPRPHWHYLHLPDRVPGAQMPQVKVVDMVAERRQRKGIHLMSCTLEDELKRTLAHKHQAVILLNRRGFANWVACPDHHCGWQMRCDHCDAGMIYHRDMRLPSGGVLKCHHCGAEQRLPATCPCCGKRTTTFGLGTQRVEDEIAQKFPSVRMVRMDADTMKKAEDYRLALDSFRAGEADILLGTQMVAKGLDFPNVTLVGVISADTALNLPDFRACERTFQLISQVAGRAGRGAEPGRVVVQTFQPDAAPIVRAVAHDFIGFADAELVTRFEAQLPPAVRMARLLLRGENEAKTREKAEALAQAALAFIEGRKLPVRLTAAAPCAVARVADHFRFEFQMYAADPQAIQRVLAHLRPQGAVASVELAVDVDPVALM